MFGHRVAIRSTPQPSGRAWPPRREPRPASEDERNEVYTDLATLLALSEADRTDPALG